MRSRFGLERELKHWRIHGFSFKAWAGDVIKRVLLVVVAKKE